MCEMAPVQFEEGQFDLYTDPTTGKTTPIRSFTWKNDNNISVQVINYGATITSMKIPSKNGAIEDVVMGFSDLKGYKNSDNPYFGATIGRVCNRIRNSQVPINNVIYHVTNNLGKHQLHGGLKGFDKYQNPLNRYFGATIGRMANRINKGEIKIGETPYKLGINHGSHHLHGGIKGFDKVIWEHYIEGSKLILSYHSADLEEGYPGDLVVQTSFELTNSNEFIVEFKAITTKPTVVNMTNHGYFNLAGHNKGAAELYKHVVCINADKITETDIDSIPTGVLKPVAGTPYDFQVPKVLGDVIQTVSNNGYDQNFCINKGPQQGTTFVARVHHPESGRVMEIYSDQPGVQFYTSNFLPEDPKAYKGNVKDLKTLKGKEGNYYKHGALCLETQIWPDAPNHENFPSAILYPGHTYKHYVSYKFSINDD